eukprot:5056771-Lingulodinium_polyedra.AAC.1
MLVKEAADAEGIVALKAALAQVLNSVIVGQKDLPVCALEARAPGLKLARGLVVVLVPTPGILGSSMADM